jgi:glycosyltransferase involved in cell wall biosynthesis
VKPHLLVGSRAVFGSFGFARHEKGSDMLAEAVERCLADERFASARFVLQWGEDYTDARGRRITLSNRVRTDPRVRIIDSPLDEQRYSEMLDSVSALILPYRRSSYYARLSRVSIEAACRGIPIIATPQTHLAWVIDEMGAGLLMEGETADHLVAAMARFLGCAPQLTAQAAARAPRARRYFSPETFMETMIRSFDA